jgi:hypothetical protein
VEWVDMAAVVWAATVEVVAQAQAADLEVVPVAAQGEAVEVLAAVVVVVAVDDLRV